MKIAFLGKGGSGKSTLATAAVRYFHGKGTRVLAIDADHNMDLSLNLGVDASPITLGSDPALIKLHLGLSPTATFAESFTEATRLGMAFHLEPIDEFTAQVTTSVEPRLLLMIAGPHTDIVRSGEHCSHSLAAPLKVYLPLLKLNPDEAVVIDERAGTDPVATGILKGVDCAVIVVEPTIHSVRVAGQISAELSLSNIAHVFVANKTESDNDELKKLPAQPVLFISRSIRADISPDYMNVLINAIGKYM